MIHRRIPQRIATGIFWVIALFYAYGALVHMMNILGLTGFQWSKAPLKWQLLDIVYLGLDLLVVVGFFAQWKLSYAAFYLAATSQIILYTALRAWILDVPEEFAISPKQLSYLNGLVAFHVAALLLVTVAIRLRASQPRGGNLQPTS